MKNNNALLEKLKQRTPRISYNSKTNESIQPTDQYPTPPAFFLSSCTDCQFDFSSIKISNIFIERCKNTTTESTITISSVISTIEIVACEDLTIKVVNPDLAGTITMDKCKNIKFVGNGNFDAWNIYSSSSEGVKLWLNGDLHEIPSSVGYEFILKSFKEGDAYVSKPSNNFGQ